MRLLLPSSAPVAIACLLALGGCAISAGDSASLTEPGALDRGLAMINGEDLAEHVRVLASDAFEGRFPGTAGEAKTVAYMTAALACAGIEPAVDGSYLQEVPLLAVTPDVEATGMRVFVEGVADEVAVRFPDDCLLWNTPGRAHRSLEARGVVFAGFGIVAPEFGWDDYDGVDVEGKIVITLWGDPGRSRDDAEFFGGTTLSRHAGRQAKADLAWEHGAVALLIVHEVAAAPVSYELIAEHVRQMSYELMGQGSDDEGFVHGSLQEARMRALLDVSGLSFDNLREEASTDDFRARVLPWTVSLDVVAEVKPVMSHNVVGILRGSVRPDEFVVYTAHWDHVGIRDSIPATLDEYGNSVEPDRICNGAVDNATGTAALLELGKAFGALPEPPERSIVFIGTTSEEQGLLGAYYYADNPLFPLETTAAVINMDALFPFGRTKGMTVVALGSTDIEDDLAVAAEVVGRRLYADSQPEAGAFYRSDHYPFAVKGVPAIFAVGGPAQDPDVGETLGPEPFMAYMKRYHQPSDEYDAETWDMEGIVQDVQMFFHTGWSIAMSPRFPNWSEDSEYRAVRDAMRGDG